MGAITLDGILKAEHDIIVETLINTKENDTDIRDSFYYIFGVNDFANELMRKLEGNGGDHNN